MAIQSMVAVSTPFFFFPFLSPLFDDHFVERQPDHTHIYLGEVVTGHIYPCEVPHSHEKPERGPGRLVMPVESGTYTAKGSEEA